MKFSVTPIRWAAIQRSSYLERPYEKWRARLAIRHQAFREWVPLALDYPIIFARCSERVPLHMIQQAEAKAKVRRR
jgi:hypothetical protein